MKKLEDMYVAEHCRNLLRHEVDMDAERSRAREEAGFTLCVGLCVGVRTVCINT